MWLSPNQWSEGSRYGNVAFAFDWVAITEGAQLYWVEAMTQYSPTACRLLVTQSDRGRHLQPYDPRSDRGPIRHDDDGWWWNGNYCLEVMVERDVALSECVALTSVAHHDKLCCIDPRSCEWRGTSAGVAGAHLLAEVVSQRLDAGLIARALEDTTAEPPAFSWWRELRRTILNSWQPGGSARMADPSAPSSIAIARAALHEFARRSDEGFAELLALFGSEEDAGAACKAAVADALELDDPSELPDAHRFGVWRGVARRG